VTAISVFDQGPAVARPSVTAGQIGKLWGLDQVQIGDVIGHLPVAADHHFAPPTLETVVVPASPADTGALHAALAQLAEQDPLINLRQDDLRQEMLVSLYGEVQKEVIQATLASDFGLHVGFRETTTICVERPAGTGEAAEHQHVGDNPFLATVGLRVEPAGEGAGVSFRLGVELGSMPLAFFRVVEDTVHETLEQGLRGWQVTDCVVTMTASGYSPRQSHAHQGFDKSMSSTGEDFRGITPLVLMTALQTAGTQVCEPMSALRLEFPADCVPGVLARLARLRGTPFAPVLHGGGCVLEAEIPAGQVHALQQALPALTRGEGMLEAEFARYQPVRGQPPVRPRTDHNPLDRKEYLGARR
jgi:ribosomal protection tetracycline resistance protein